MLKKIGLYFSAILITFIICEIFMNVFKLGSTLSDNTNIFKFRRKPNGTIINISEGYSARKINSYGLPDREYGNNTNSLRFFLFGNSFTEAMQVDVDQTYENITEDKLSKLLNNKVEIWNFARGGTSLIDNVASFCSLSDLPSCNYVIIQFYSANLYNLDFSAGNVTFDSVIHIMNESPKKISFFENSFAKLRTHSVVINMLYVRMHNIKKDIERYFSKDKSDLENVQTYKENDAKKISVPQEQLIKFGQLIKYFAEKVKQKNAKLIIFTFPIEYDKQYINFYKDECIKNNATYLDMSNYKEFSDTTDFHTLGFINNRFGYGHLSPHGHKVMANALTTELLNYFKTTKANIK